MDKQADPRALASRFVKAPLAEHHACEQKHRGFHHEPCCKHGAVDGSQDGDRDEFRARVSHAEETLRHGHRVLVRLGDVSVDERLNRAIVLCLVR